MAPSSEKGTGYKAGYLFIAPLCKPHTVIDVASWDMLDSMGCHIRFDRHRSDFDGRFPDFDPIAESAKVEAAWLAFSGIPERGVKE
jgi:hypothetical protein